LDKVLLSDTFSRASISFILNHALFYFISYLVWFFDRYQKAKEQTWKLEKEKLELKMLFLKSQISPHFFFNTLNNIYALSLVKSDKAPQLIALLSDLMRYFVYDGNQVSVSIKEEIKVLEKYLEIQKIRELKGGDHITFHCASIDESIKIPPLLLITLLENAFKHGDINENEKGYVRVSLHDENTGQLHFLVENSFVENNQKAGIGLTNFKSQLDLLFGKNYEFQIEKKDNCYTSSLIIYGFEK
jgi:LytS/YehU family sensor histidine kinase